MQDILLRDALLKKKNANLMWEFRSSCVCSCSHTVQVVNEYCHGFRQESDQVMGFEFFFFAFAYALLPCYKTIIICRVKRHLTDWHFRKCSALNFCPVRFLFHVEFCAEFHTRKRDCTSGSQRPFGAFFVVVVVLFVFVASRYNVIIYARYAAKSLRTPHRHTNVSLLNMSFQI